jgi:hypothetical protein
VTSRAAAKQAKPALMITHSPGHNRNGTVANILGGIIVLFAAVLGIRTIYLALLTAGVVG